MAKFYVESTEKFVMESETTVLPKTMVRTVRGGSLLIHDKERVVIETNEEVFGISEQEVMFIETGSLIPDESNVLLREFKENLKKVAAVG